MCVIVTNEETKSVVAYVTVDSVKKFAFDAANEVHYANNSIPGFEHPTLKLADLCSTIEALTVAVKVVTELGAVCK